MENQELALLRKYMIYKKIDGIVGRNRLNVKIDLLLTLFSFYNCSTFLFLIGAAYAKLSSSCVFSARLAKSSCNLRLYCLVSGCLLQADIHISHEGGLPHLANELYQCTDQSSPLCHYYFHSNIIIIIMYTYAEVAKRQRYEHPLFPIFRSYNSTPFFTFTLKLESHISVFLCRGAEHE
jgi:hypothetical protein